MYVHAGICQQRAVEDVTGGGMARSEMEGEKEETGTW